MNDGPVSFHIKGISRSYVARQLLLDDAVVTTSFPLDDSAATPTRIVRLSLIGRDDKFIDHVPDKGFMQIDASGKKVDCLDDKGKPVAEAAWLDVNGKQSTAPLFVDFEIENEADFSGLFSGLS